MSYRPKGKHVYIDATAPQALGICDYTGFVHNRKDLIRQMEWRGNAIVWTGFYVGRDYADVPNEQLRPPLLPPDPVPINEPRNPQGQTETYTDNTLGVINQIFQPINMIGATANSLNFISPLDGEPVDTMAQIPDGDLALREDLRLTALQNFYWGA